MLQPLETYLGSTVNCLIQAVHFCLEQNLHAEFCPSYKRKVRVCVYMYLYIKVYLISNTMQQKFSS